MSNVCSVCLCTAADSEQQWSCLSSCGHTFHTECLNGCLAAASGAARGPKCPICRADIATTQTARDKSALQRNHAIEIRLDISGSQPSGISLQAPSQATDLHRQEIAAVHRRCCQLQEELEVLKEKAQAERLALTNDLTEALHEKKRVEADLVVARQQASSQKRDLTAQIKREHSNRQAAETKSARLQEALDRHQLLHNPDLTKEDLERIALRNRGAVLGKDPNVFVQAIKHRNERYSQLLSETQRSVQVWETQQARHRQEVQERDSEVAELKRRLKSESDAREHAEQQAAALRAELASAATAPSQDSGAALHHQQESRTEQTAPAAAHAEAEDDGWVDLEAEEAVEAGDPPLQTLSSSRQPYGALQPSAPRLPGGGSSFLGSHLGVVASRLAEPSFMRSGACTSSSGQFIREGPDGRGGRVKVLGAAKHQAPTFLKQPAGVHAAGAIKRRKGPSNRGATSRSMTIEMFMAPKDSVNER